MSHNNHSAIYLDFENIFIALEDSLPGSFDVLGSVTSLLRNLRKYVETEYGARPTILKAYADFERLNDDVQRALFLTGFDPQYVLGTDHKNAADMRLCIDAIAVLYTRPDVEWFVVVAGDRDYIPVINHLIERGKRVLVVSLMESLSGDLRTVAGEDCVLDASQFLPEATVKAIAEKKRKKELDAKSALVQEEIAKRKSQEAAIAPPEPLDGPKIPTEYAKVKTITDVHTIDALSLIVREYGHFPEIWLSPVLRVLETEFAWMASWERKEMIETMADKGAIAIEQRDGGQRLYSVIVLNWNHPQVQELNP